MLSLTAEDVIVTIQAILVITVNTVDAEAETIATVRSEDVTLVTQTTVRPRHGNILVFTLMK